ncbi:hypothetical protein ATI61_111382 [Archangium gephyra]|uniref:Uncharacterized protein n=1 Tax=Archangium gephyra TaxID=48 RepID=A0AAC8QH69_9BACT|nr:hypothetical protein [Archangium gephyra]AKJ07435.1 Hypothetical protein AA314_09061 [Archangium gephyra]REG26831.1 hypothetical protein ATI61_111382 [Archangium gephyra]
MKTQKLSVFAVLALGAAVALLAPTSSRAESAVIDPMGMVLPTSLPKVTFYFRAPGGTKLTGTFIAEDVGKAAPKNTVIASANVTAADKMAATFTLARPTNGWPTGQYRLEVKHGDKLVHVQRFMILAAQ